jgi:FkbM family methyltransferase
MGSFRSIGYLSRWECEAAVTGRIKGIDMWGQSMGRSVGIRERTARSITWLLGRQATVRLGRFLLNAGRADGCNAMDSNGELLIARQFLGGIDRRAAICAMDVGANVGDYSAALLEFLLPKGAERSVRWIAFEPFPETVQTLTGRLRPWLDRQVAQIEDVALSNQSGVGQLLVLGANEGTNSLVAVADGTARSPHRVRLETLDHYCQERGIGQIDWLKIDAEGHDAAILAGADRMFTSQSIGAAQFEYNWRWVGDRKFLRDVFDMADKWGYRVGKVTYLGLELYDRWRPELETFVENNFLLIRPDLLPRVRTISPWFLRGPDGMRPKADG